jgi:thiamine biosynthesis lipoprotein
MGAQKIMQQQAKYVALLLSLLLMIATGCDFNRGLVHLSGSTMGTYYSVKYLPAADNAITEDVVQATLDTALATVNQQMSTYIPDSEISQFNRSTDTSWTDVSEDFAYVISVAQTVAEASDGAFDVTIGPLIELWGFGVRQQNDAVPTPSEIEAAKARTGYHKLQYKQRPPLIRKTEPELQISLSAIAKGFGVDKLIVTLQKMGIQNAMVDIGGEIRTMGLNNGKPWVIGVNTPTAAGGVATKLFMQDDAMATSGDYNNYFEKNGVRYSHTIDPQTGSPISHKLASVSVITPECTHADAWATALNVLGPEAGLKLARRLELPVFMLVKADSGFAVESTASLQKYHESERK